MKHVIFDVGNVLLRWDPEAILKQHLPPQYDKQTVLSLSFRNDIWQRFDAGSVTMQQLIEQFSEALKMPPSVIADLFQQAMQSLKPLPGSFELVHALNHSKIPLYCITNMSVEFWEYLRETFSIWSVFKEIVVSGQLKMVKPDPEIFWHLLRRHGLKPEQTIFIDDHPPNIAAATELGMETILFTTAENCRARLVELKIFTK